MIRNFGFAVPILLWLAPAVLAQANGPSGNWPLDEIVLKSGARFDGLIVKETPSGAQFRIVRRPPGRPTITLTTFFDKQETLDFKRISEADRTLLRERLAELDGQESSERERMAGIEWKPAKWLGKDGAAKRYESERFELISAAPEPIARKAAVRLEQIYTAFGRVLPERHPGATPTRIELAGTLDDYREGLKASGVKVLNAAVFFPAENRIACGSDLKKLGEELQRSQLHHEPQLAAAKKTEAELRELYKGPAHKDELARFLAAVKKEREKLAQAERENTAAFDTATQRLFAILYHEAFHSYARNFVFPPKSPEEIRAGQGTGELPRWLNEGLAQLFEDPVIEAGELRIGHAEPQRLKRIQESLSGKPNGREFPALVDLLRAGQDQFVTAHASTKATTDRSYSAAWALAHYLAFERRLIGTAALDDYLRSLNTGTEPAKAFAVLVGQELPEFEKDWREFLKRLQPDGSLRK